MSTQRPDNNIITYRPVPLVSQPRVYNQNSYGYSPVVAFSMPCPKQVYSPLLVVTPMDTPMVEDDSDENVHNDNPIYLDQDVFVFDEQMERQPQPVHKTPLNVTVMPSTYQSKTMPGLSVSCLNRNENQQSPIQRSSMTSEQTIREQPISVSDFGVVHSFGENNNEEIDGLCEEDENDSQDFEECDDGDDEESQVIQEVLERVRQLKKIGEERNKLLHNMIQNQK